MSDPILRSCERGRGLSSLIVGWKKIRIDFDMADGCRGFLFPWEREDSPLISPRLREGGDSRDRMRAIEERKKQKSSSLASLRPKVT